MRVTVQITIEVDGDCKSQRSEESPSTSCDALSCLQATKQNLRESHMKKIESTRPESVQLVKAVSNGIRDALKAAHPRTEQNKIVLWIRELFRGVTMLTRVLRK